MEYLVRTTAHRAEELAGGIKGRSAAVAATDHYCAPLPTPSTGPLNGAGIGRCAMPLRSIQCCMAACHRIARCGYDCMSEQIAVKRPAKTAWIAYGFTATRRDVRVRPEGWGMSAYTIAMTG